MPVVRDLLGATLLDVIVEGYVDREDGLLRFANMGRRVQLAFDDRWLVCTLVPYDGRLLLEVRDTRSPADDPRLADENLSAAYASVVEAVLWSWPSDPRLLALRAHRPLLDEAGSLIACDALRLDLSTGQIVFVDPTHLSGIRLGDDRDEARWRESWPRANEGEPWTAVISAGR